MTICIMGIDPGISGAVGFYFPDYPERISAHDVPTVDNRINAVALVDHIERMAPDACVIELVGAMPRQGLGSTFRFGQSYGTVIGIVAALKIPVHFVAPTKWKRHYGLSSDKEEARRRALDLWPACASQFAKKKDHGRAEAALLARYGAEKVFTRSDMQGRESAEGSRKRAPLITAD